MNHQEKQMMNQVKMFNQIYISYFIVLLDIICRDYAPGTYLPIPYHSDAYIICGDDNRSISMKCKSGFIYNALTTACENGN
jgi:hypothetical protein